MNRDGSVNQSISNRDGSARVHEGVADEKLGFIRLRHHAAAASREPELTNLLFAKR